MAHDHSINNFTAADIEKYHKGLLSPKERHALEKAALDDPFLADALEGYSTPGVNPSADLELLKKRLSDRIYKDTGAGMSGSTVKGSFAWWKVAAVVVVILGAGYFTYQLTSNEKNETNIAQVPAAQQEQRTTPATDTVVSNMEKQDSIPTTAVELNNNTAVVTAPSQNVTVGSTSNDLYKTKDTSFNSNVFSPGRATATVVTPPPANFDTASAYWTDVAEAKKREDAITEQKEQLNSRQAADKQAMNEAGVVAKSKSLPAKSAAANYRNTFNNFRGRVTDGLNNGVPFANVTNTRDNVGTYTDARGYFNLTSPDSTLNVNIRALSYNDDNVTLRNNVVSNQVVLEEDKSIAAQTISNRKVNFEKYSRNANMKLEGLPEPEDGWENYDSYLSNNLNVPDEVKTKQMDNPQVEVSFEVNKLGQPVNFKVVKSLCSTCDQEAIRLIKDGPKWKRKAKKGRTTVTVSF